MAIVQHLVERSERAGDNELRDKLRTVLVAIDDTVDTTDADVQARAVAVLNANGFDLPDGYFDTNRLLNNVGTDGSSVTFDAAGDFACWGHNGRKLAEVIA